MRQGRLLGALGAVFVLSAVGAFFPARQPSMPEPSLAHEGSNAAVCSIEQGSGRNTVVPVASLVDGPARLEVFAGGSAAGSADATVGAGAASFAVSDVAAVGLAGALGELPAADAAASAALFGEGLLALEACVASPSTQVMVAGGSTTSEQGFLLHLMNPYAADARVELTVTSESGLESNDRFESLSVPSGDSVTLDMARLIPGREVIVVTVDAAVGNVVVAGRQQSGTDSALWTGAVPGQDWFIPVPAAVRDGRLLLVSPINAPVEFQLDLYSEEGFEENYLTGTVPARGQTWVELADAPGERVAFRVLSAAPMVATLVSSDEDGVAVTNGVPIASSQWLFAGLGSLAGAAENLVFLNPGLETATVRLDGLGESSPMAGFELEPDSVAEIGIEAAEGYLISATGEIVVVWIAWGEGSIALAGGTPVGE